MSELKYNNKDLPGEEYYRQFINNIESRIREYYRFYQEWRMSVGLYMADIDVIVSDQMIESFNSMRNIEYDHATDYALLEMKHWRTQEFTIQNIIDCFHPTKRLAEKANLPFFVIKYFPKQECQEWQFTVYPANELARKILPEPMHMSERNYVYFLYKKLRGLEVPDDLLNSLSKQKNANYKI